MQYLKSGEFFGVINETTRMEGIILTDTEYTHERVDWHYHENPYFTFILQGNVIEGNKKEIYNCSAGTLLFHNWDDAHYNNKPPGFTRGFHIEQNKDWFMPFGIDIDNLQGNINISDPAVKLLMYAVFKENKLNGNDCLLAIEALLVEMFTKMQGNAKLLKRDKPLWVERIKEMLHEIPENLRLTDIANDLNLHPVHLSRDFSKHFNCTLGDYTRKIRLEKALVLLSRLDYSLTDIAMECHFADQSHFIRSFRSQYCITPLQYRKLLLNK